MKAHNLLGKISNAKNFPPKSKALRKKPQMRKTTRKNPRHRGKNLKCQKLPAKIQGTKEKTSNAKNFPPKLNPQGKNLKCQKLPAKIRDTEEKISKHLYWGFIIFSVRFFPVWNCGRVWGTLVIMHLQTAHCFSGSSYLPTSQRLGPMHFKIAGSYWV